MGTWKSKIFFIIVLGTDKQWGDPISTVKHFDSMRSTTDKL